MSNVAVLTAARDSLTEETWFRGEYFGFYQGRLCYCAHGAVQLQTNQDLLNRLMKLGPASVKVARDLATIMRAATAASVPELKNQVNHPDPMMVWRNRPDWISRTQENRGSAEAHYLLGMVGLTSAFNDQHTTSISMVANRFTQAIELAQRLGL